MSARVLIIEDNPDNLELMTYLLRAFGHAVLAAVNGRQGLEVACREHPDLIICDVQLPEMDGYEVARRLKADGTLRNTPLVAVTALAMVGDRERVLAAGFDGYPAKPIYPETFVRQMEVYLRAEQQTTAPPTPSGKKGRAPAEPVPRDHTILVVDNLPVNLDLARSILEPCGFDVITAGGSGRGTGPGPKVPL